MTKMSLVRLHPTTHQMTALGEPTASCPEMRRGGHVTGGFLHGNMKRSSISERWWLDHPWSGWMSRIYGWVAWLIIAIFRRNINQETTEAKPQIPRAKVVRWKNRKHQRAIWAHDPWHDPWPPNCINQLTSCVHGKRYAKSYIHNVTSKAQGKIEVVLLPTIPWWIALGSGLPGGPRGSQGAQKPTRRGGGPSISPMFCWFSYMWMVRKRFMIYNDEYWSIMIA